MLTLNDGRSELYQWDTGRKLSVAVECTQVHYSNKVFGRSIDVDVVDGVAIIPDILLQTDKELTAWVFDGTPENGCTKISKTFKVKRRNKPADYVFTPPEQTTLGELVERLQKIEETQDPDAIKNAVEDYLGKNPVAAPVQSVNGKKGEVQLTAKDVGAISQDDLQNATNKALEQAKESGEFDGKAGTSVTVSSISESTASGGTNVVTFSDGKKVNIKNGTDGKTPAKGVDYFTPEEVQEIAEIAADIVKDAGDEWEALTVTDVARLLISPKGGLLSGSEDKLVSEPISIRGGDALRVTGSAKYGNSLWAIYNSAGEMIANQVAPATAAGLTVAEQEIEAPNGAASIRVAWDKTISDTPYAVSRKAAEQTEAALPLDGQTLVVLGDSIVQGQGIANDLCTRLAAATGANVVNLGVGGSGWMHRQEEDNAYYQRIADIPENADIVILSGGGNDRNDPLGTADSTGTDTVAGCIHATLDAVRARVPAARVCVAAPTPWQYYPPHNRGNDIAKLVDVMAEICRRRGIPFLDLYHTSGLAPWDDTIRALLFVDGDGVHPNDLGYGVFAPQVVSLALGGSHNPVDVQGVAEAVLASELVPGGGGGEVWVELSKGDFADVSTVEIDCDMDAYRKIVVYTELKRTTTGHVTVAVEKNGPKMVSTGFSVNYIGPRPGYIYMDLESGMLFHPSTFDWNCYAQNVSGPTDFHYNGHYIGATKIILICSDDKNTTVSANNTITGKYVLKGVRR